MGLKLRALVVGSGFEPLKAKPADLKALASYLQAFSRVSFDLNQI
jgi:hypothetical protein